MSLLEIERAVGVAIGGVSYESISSCMRTISSERRRREGGDRIGEGKVEESEASRVIPLLRLTLADGIS